MENEITIPIDIDDRNPQNLAGESVSETPVEVDSVKKKTITDKRKLIIYSEIMTPKF